MAIITDYTDANYNSYIALVEANTRIAAFAPFYDVSAWNALSDVDKENLIIRATADANAFVYLWEISNSIISPYNMRFPGKSVQYSNGVDIPDNEIPEFVKAYVAQRCVEILSYTDEDHNEAAFLSNIKKERTEGIETTYFSASERADIKTGLTDFRSYLTISDYVSSSPSGAVGAKWIY